MEPAEQQEANLESGTWNEEPQESLAEDECLPLYPEPTRHLEPGESQEPNLEPGTWNEEPEESLAEDECLPPVKFVCDPMHPWLDGLQC